MGVGGEGRDLCYAGPFNDVTLLIILALKGNKGFRFERGVGWGVGKCQQKNTDCNVRKVYFCILINIVQLKKKRKFSAFYNNHKLKAKCLSTFEWISKLWYNHKMDVYK